MGIRNRAAYERGRKRAVSEVKNSHLWPHFRPAPAKAKPKRGRKQAQRVGQPLKALDRSALSHLLITSLLIRPLVWRRNDAAIPLGRPREIAPSSTPSLSSPSLALPPRPLLPRFRPTAGHLPSEQYAKPPDGESSPLSASLSRPYLCGQISISAIARPISFLEKGSRSLPQEGGGGDNI